ncbi:UNKNOWN [Stylonychia lemnae]|uniref:Uncharacterized protein n=1 Tax=Stylonychia lemnae TaxID=5949 RepID=A0A078AZM7_STYLE|nr:UNKNOWN [Stylonychia lemnae]|eukprot:CDW87870.1 UNKNOWN [Stylonychia lemnae]
MEGDSDNSFCENGDSQQEYYQNQQEEDQDYGSENQSQQQLDGENDEDDNDDLLEMSGNGDQSYISGNYLSDHQQYQQQQQQQYLQQQQQYQRFQQQYQNEDEEEEEDNDQLQNQYQDQDQEDEQDEDQDEEEQEEVEDEEGAEDQDQEGDQEEDDGQNEDEDEDEDHDLREPTKPQILYQQQQQMQQHQLLNQQQQYYNQLQQQQLQRQQQESQNNQVQAKQQQQQLQKVQLKQSQHQQQKMAENQDEDQDEDEQNNESEEEDQVNDMSFSHIDYKQQFQQQRQQNGYTQQQQNQNESEEGEDQEQEQADEDEEEEEDDDQEIGEMKAKFDKIMANFVDENKKSGKQSYIHSNDDNNMNSIQNRDKTLDFKNKNMQKNVKGIINKPPKAQPQNIQNNQHQQYTSNDDEDDQYDAVVEGPDRDNDEQSVNIKINNKQLFPQKPPMPLKSVLKNGGKDQQRSSTPDREQALRERIQNQNMQHQQQLTAVNIRSYSQNNENCGQQLARPKSASRPGGIQSQKQFNAIQQQMQPQQQLVAQKISLKRPQTAVVKKNNLTQQTQQIFNDENTMDPNNMLKKAIVPKFKRPQTASVKSAGNFAQFKANKNVKKKTDPVSRYQSLQNEWKTNSFLKQSNNKQGRKLDLDRFHKWSSLVHAHNSISQQKKGQVHKFIPNNKGPTEDRRDDMRFQLRAKMSQKDYVDKQMKVFHYNQEIQQPAHHKNVKAPTSQQQFIMNQMQLSDQYEVEDKLEVIKKQINNLKKCV